MRCLLLPTLVVVLLSPALSALAHPDHPVEPNAAPSQTAPAPTGPSEAANPALPAPRVNRSFPPALYFPEKSVEWGTVSDALPLKRDLLFTNITDPPRRVRLSVKTSCGCTAAFVNKMEFAPGETGTLTVSFDPAGREGPYQKNVTVNIEDPPHAFASHHIPVSLDINASVKFEPPRLVTGEIDHREGAMRLVTISGSDKGFAVTKAEPAVPFIEARILPGYPVARHNGEWTEIPVELVFAKSTPVGPLDTTVVITTTDSLIPVRTFHVNAFVLGEVRAVPDRAVIRSREPDTTFTQEIRVDTPGKTALSVTGIEVDAPREMRLVADLAPVPGQHAFMLTISGVSPKPGYSYGRITLTTRSSIEETLNIPLTISVMAPRTSAPAHSATRAP